MASTDPQLPSGSHVPLSTQVGGHSGVLTTEDGSLLIKPSLPLELQFYQSSVQDPGFTPLRPFVPKFYGTLSLQGKVDESKGGEAALAVAPVEGDKKEEKDSLVLENLSHPFIKPNIIDIKLGTVLYDESASPEKVERMIKAARDTTSFETGVRLTGFQVYNNETGLAVNTPKSYGKSIHAADLPDGISRFFPVGGSASQSGLPQSTLLPILRGIREDIAELKDAFAQIHLRMVGGSVLVVYEADWERAKLGLKSLEEGAFDDENDENDDDDDDEAEKPGPPYVVKLIDFAHTRIAPGEGPDEGVLLGLNTILRLLDGRIEQVSRESEGSNQE